MKKLDFDTLLSIKPSAEEPSLGDMIYEYYRAESYSGSKDQLEKKMDDYIERLYERLESWRERMSK